jgi:hypothetical protein
MNIFDIEKKWKDFWYQFKWIVKMNSYHEIEYKSHKLELTVK